MQIINTNPDTIAIMKPAESTNKNLNASSSNNTSDVNFINMLLSPQQHATQLLYLYQKQEDEPDFDCEFLHGISYYCNETKAGSEIASQLIEEHNDNPWDTIISDSYAKPAYF